MTQFVEQLRNQAKWYAQPEHNARDLMDSRLLEKAADEIERLAAKLEAAEKSDAESLAMYRKARDERDALRTENAALVEDMNLLRNNNMTLRAKIEQMGKQEPIAWTTKLALELGSSALGFDACRGNLWGEKGVPLYALPGAKGE